jgi:hypothetical protein
VLSVEEIEFDEGDVSANYVRRARADSPLSPTGHVSPEHESARARSKRCRQKQALALRIGAQGATPTAHAAVGRPGES